jgi:hypothetical protein
VHLQDRRRLSIAALVTMLALPTLLLLNRDSGSGAPSVAAAGVGVENGYLTESGAEVGAEGIATGGPSTANLPAAAPLEETAPVFLDGPAANGGGRPAIAVPTVPPNEVLDLEATYSSQVWNWTCIVPGVQNGTELTIVNVDNGRSTTCVATYGDPRTDGHLVMHTAGFLELADLTDAPIPVEIHK